LGVVLPATNNQLIDHDCNAIQNNAIVVGLIGAGIAHDGILVVYRQ